METPIFDFVQQYQQSGTARFHMPGHKGQPFLGCEPLDITEIAGADDLHHPEHGGVIARSEQHATQLFDTACTCYSAGGSSACISAMLYLAKCAAPADCKGRILAGRNAHKVFVQACALLDIQPSWLYPAPEDAQGLCGCVVTSAALRQVLATAREEDALPMAVYITSPDYLGNLADVAGLAAVCAQYCLPLLVDNAHGAYLKFLQPSVHPMDLGATMCCDSAHKTLPVLTGGAYLHLARGAVREDTKAALELFSSTSPSYLILQSLDLCNAYLAREYPAALAACVVQVAKMKTALAAHGYAICAGEPLKITIDCRAVDGGGEALAEYLRTQGVEPEFADLDFLVCMATPQNTAQELQRLQAALLARVLQVCDGASVCGTAKACAEQPTYDVAKACAEQSICDARKTRTAQSGCGAPKAHTETATNVVLVPHQTACTLREALFSTGQTISVEKAAGRICRLASVSCPPAIPIVVSGEIITKRDIEQFQYYNIKTVNVIQEGE